MNRKRQQYLSKKALKDHKKKVRRKRLLAKQRAAYIASRAYLNRLGRSKASVSSFQKYLSEARKGPRPLFSELIQFIASQPNSFSNIEKFDPKNGYFKIPVVFSLTENCQESFLFIKRLFFALYNHRAIDVIIDYQQCRRIDLDASVCLDVLLADFLKNIHACRTSGHRTTLSVRPINYNRPEILEVLFSIGSFRNLKGIYADFPDIISFPLRVGDSQSPDFQGQREVDNTDVVTYIIDCLGKYDRTLTGDAEKELSDVIGEVLANAEEHSTTRYRYLIGYFKMNINQNDSLGIFNLVIFNFGATIYQKFKSPDCPNKEVVEQMHDLSKSYTERGFFNFLKGPLFKEETLWTLYSLQEGVTRYNDWIRGSGTIEFIESFFALKGDKSQDNVSKLTLFSGNTRIIFDGSYGTHTRVRNEPNGDKKSAKVMTFNRSGEISEQPDRNFVNFVEEFFPGTMISAKICIKPSNTEASQSEEITQSKYEHSFN